MKSLSLVADRVGVFASSACALHCLLIPTLLIAGVALPTSLLREDAIHQALLFVVLPAALVAFGLGCRRHKDRRVLGLGILGMVGISAAALFHDVLGEVAETPLTVASAGFLISAHLRNYRLCRSAHCDHG